MIFIAGGITRRLITQIRYRHGHPLCGLALACSHALSRSWVDRDRQLGSGTCSVTLGRKNYLFAGSDAGRERAAAIYTLLGTTKLNGLDAELYLRHVYYSRRPQFRRKT